MEIQLTPEQDSFVKHAIKQGRVRDTADAISRAMDIFVERERRRMELIAEIEEGELCIQRGEYTEYTEETFKNLPAIVAARGRARMAARG